VIKVAFLRVQAYGFIAVGNSGVDISLVGVCHGPVIIEITIVGEGRNFLGACFYGFIIFALKIRGLAATRLRKRSPLDTPPTKRGTQKKADDSAATNSSIAHMSPQVAVLFLSNSMEIPGEKGINSMINSS
jgi:hypothetical protein